MFYIFHGEDEHSKKQTLSQLLSKQGDPSTLELNTTRLEGAVPLATLRQVAETMPFLAPVRIVIVNDLFLAKPNKAYLDELYAFLPTLPDTTRLIFMESTALRANHAAIKLAEEHEAGYQRAFELPEGVKLQRWISGQVAERGGDISPQAVNQLAALVGNDLRVLDNEIEKLVNFKSAETPPTIGTEDIALLSPYVAEASIFDLVDALGNRNEKSASALYQRKLAEGANPFYLFSMFVRQFRLMIQVKELAEEGYSLPVIARELRLHEYPTGKLHQQARGFSMDELEIIYRHLLKIDAAAKDGTSDMRTELDLLIANLTMVEA